MTRSLFSGAFLIVEGSTDARVYEQFINESTCKLYDGHGKANTLNVLEILEKDKFNGVLAIVDSDFFILDNYKPSSTNVQITDSHDLESMILSSKTLENVLSEFASGPKIAAFAKPIREALLESATPIGLLRWLSTPAKEGLLLKCSELRFYRFIDRASLSTDIDELINEVLSKSSNKTQFKPIKERVTILLSEGHDVWQVCSGHDMAEILCIGLRHIFGNRRARQLCPEAVEGLLRVAYDSSLFCLTRLYKSIKEWEKINSPFCVLS